MNPLELIESMCLTAEHVVTSIRGLGALGRVLYHFGLWVSPTDSDAHCFICGYPIFPYKILRNEDLWDLIKKLKKDSNKRSPT